METEKETKEEWKKLKDRQDLWKLLEDYGLFERDKLQKDIQEKMVCRACVEQFLDSPDGHLHKVDVKHFCLKLSSRNSAFALLLTVPSIHTS